MFIFQIFKEPMILVNTAPADKIIFGFPFGKPGRLEVDDQPPRAGLPMVGSGADHGPAVSPSAQPQPPWQMWPGWAMGPD